MAPSRVSNKMDLTDGTLWVQHVVAGGDVAPLVGHNAFLRWSAIKDCAFMDSSDGQLKYWSEAHVSEDFDMSVRMQIHNYIGRYIAYTGTGAHLHPPSVDMPHVHTLTRQVLARLNDRYKSLQGSVVPADKSLRDSSFACWSLQGSPPSTQVSAWLSLCKQVFSEFQG